LLEVHIPWLCQAAKMQRASAAAPDRWFFYQDAANLWKWARIDVFGTVLSYSGASFPTRDECIDDAGRSGYREEPAGERPAVALASARRPLRAPPPRV
jgi:hypothetical protein